MSGPLRVRIGVKGWDRDHAAAKAKAGAAIGPYWVELTDGENTVRTQAIVGFDVANYQRDSDRFPGALGGQDLPEGPAFLGVTLHLIAAPELVYETSEAIASDRRAARKSARERAKATREAERRANASRPKRGSKR